MSRQIVLVLLIIATSRGLNAIVHGGNLMNHNVNSSFFDRPLNFADGDLMSLSELPLESLLKIKKSMNELRQTSYVDDDDLKVEDDVIENRVHLQMRPIFTDPKLKKSALALTEEPIRKTGYGMMENPWDSKPSKVQTFFQISITALAFLSFAGYLLCMIVQAIKSKNTMYMYPNTMALTNGVNTMNSLTNTGAVPLRKRRPIGRRKRSVFLSADYRNETELLMDESFATPDPAEMYNVMIQCAEDYTKLYFVQ